MGKISRSYNRKKELLEVINESNAHKYAALTLYGPDELLRRFDEPLHELFEDSLAFLIATAIIIYINEDGSWIRIWEGDEYED